jgi:hypothetical protein
MVNKDGWQDYRGKNEGVLIHLDTVKEHLLPIHLSENDRGQIIAEPGYEGKGTVGFFNCEHAKTRLAAFKNRRRYFLFGTRYQGLAEAFKGKFLVIGVMRLDKEIDVRKRHVHKWMEAANVGTGPGCTDMEECYAFSSEELNFYAPEDCFELSEKLMKDWGYKGKITKQMKLTFTEEKIKIILEHFKSKTPANAAYAKASKKLAEAVPAHAHDNKTDAW